jgi:predicted permease
MIRADGIHVRALRGLARVLLLCYSRTFRRTHGAAFADAAEHRWHRTRRARGVVSASTATAYLLIADTIASAPRTWSMPSGPRLNPRRWLQTFPGDVRFGLRLLKRHPGFTAAAVLVLTLGIGANLSMFSLVNQLLLAPRPGGIDALLVGVHSRDRNHPDTYRRFSFADYAALRQRREVFRSLSAHDFGLAGITEGGTTRRAFVDIVTADYFETFGVAPLLGRAFTVDEERPGADIPVVILSHSTWRRMGGSDAVVGRQLVVNARAFTIVGVAPPAFGGSLAVASPELYVPTGVYDSMAYDAVSEGRGARLADPQNRAVVVVGRLHDQATRASVTPALEVISNQRSAADPTALRDEMLEIAPLSRFAVSSRPQNDNDLVAVTALLMTCSALVLLVASFNLANMLLARGRARRREFAVRAAIGGSRARIVQQLITENGILAIAGGAGGLLVSWWTVRLLAAALPASLPLTFTIQPSLDGRVIAATLICCALGALLSGLLPALRIVRADPMTELRGHGGDAVETPRRWRRRWTTRDGLVTVQLALTLVLLTSAGLFVRGAVAAAASDPGFTLDRGVLVNVDASLAGYDAARSRDTYRRVLERFRAMPGVDRVSFGSLMPFGEFNDSRHFQRAGPVVRPEDPNAGATLISATATSVGPAYFESLGLPMLRGRDFTDADAFATEGEPIAIVDAALADRLFAGRDPLGELIQYSHDDSVPPTVLRVIGVAAAIRDNLFDAAATPHVYTPFGRDFRTNIYFHLTTSGESADQEAAMLPSLRAALHEVDARLPLVMAETRPMFRDRSLMVWILRAAAGLTGGLALAALTIAVVGVYGVKAYLVARRTREIGVRVALGATRRDVFGLVFREGLTIAAIGLALGLALSLAAGQAMRSMLFQGRAFDLVVVAAAALALVGSAALATWLPARRALRIEPTRALRTE